MISHPSNSILFLGSKHLGLHVIKKAFALSPKSIIGIVTIDDSSDDRGCLPDFRVFCQSQDLPLEVLTKPSALGPFLDQYRPDLVLVCGWYWKIPAELLAKAPGGFIGLHASLLPRYRGFAPLVWSLINGEPEAGLSLFYLEDGLDTGDILSQKRFPLGPDTTIAEALVLTEQHSIVALGETLPLLLKGQAPRKVQDQSQASWCSQRKPENGLIDWAATASDVHNAVRAQTHPYPGAFTRFQDRKLYIWKSARFTGEYFGVPGQIVENRNGEAMAACGQGAVRLLEVQLEGDSPRPAGEILKYGAKLG